MHWVVPTEHTKANDLKTDLFLAVLRVDEHGRSATRMSTIYEVRAAEEKMSNVLEALKRADAQDSNYLGAELRSASDEYTRAVRELRMNITH
jgi:hypothetical protein